MIDDLLARLDIWAEDKSTPFPQCECIALAAAEIRRLRAARGDPVAEFKADENGYITPRALSAWGGEVGYLYFRTGQIKRLRGWCSCCDKIEDVHFCDGVSVDGKKYSDLCCTECHLIIATLEGWQSQPDAVMEQQSELAAATERAEQAEAVARQLDSDMVNATRRYIQAEADLKRAAAASRNAICSDDGRMCVGECENYIELNRYAETALGKMFDDTRAKAANVCYMIATNKALMHREVERMAAVECAAAIRAMEQVK